MLALSQWAKQVGREKHRMEAFVRFKKCQDGLFLNCTGLMRSSHQDVAAVESVRNGRDPGRAGCAHRRHGHEQLDQRHRREQRDPPDGVEAEKQSR